MDYLSIAHEEELAFIEYCKNYVKNHPEDDKESHFNYLYNSTRERRGFLYEYSNFFLNLLQIYII